MIKTLHLVHRGSPKIACAVVTGSRPSLKTFQGDWLKWSAADIPVVVIAIPELSLSAVAHIIHLVRRPFRCVGCEGLLWDEDVVIDRNGGMSIDDAARMHVPTAQSVALYTLDFLDSTSERFDLEIS